ncbi:MAG: hypothetical protein HY567_04555 [Candidatus Kerfeldbacteria bacterium]|nr:hypothetical protein [Candidatus Kerfeldbacteria bacterium]
MNTEENRPSEKEMNEFGRRFMTDDQKLMSSEREQNYHEYRTEQLRAICEKALIAFYDAFDEYLQIHKPGQKTDRHGLHEQNIVGLAKGIPLRLGAPGWGQAKLMMLQPPLDSQDSIDNYSFHMFPNGKEDEEMKAWESFLATKFQERGLKYTPYTY